MLHYPKIPDTRGCPGGTCIAFDKIDGTNLHFRWSKDHGWHSFGTRRDSFLLSEAGNLLFLAAHPGLEGALEAFDQTLRAPLECIFVEARLSEAVVFAELVGEGSFAGEHVPGKEKRLVLFDVDHGAGLVEPGVFVATYGHLSTPRVLFRGKFSGQLVEDIRLGHYEVEEGAVIKGGAGDKLWMAKVKTDAYVQKLKSAGVGDD